MPDKPLYDISAIEEILPHRSPFLFVDRVMKLRLGEEILAEKDLSPGECFFAGHFPGNPIMPGVLVLESLAQTSGLLIGLEWKERGQPVDGEKPNFFLANLNIKFSAPAKPDETLRLESRLKRKYGKFFLFDVTAYAGSRQVAKGTLTLAEENS